jgi:hypothetical protein
LEKQTQPAAADLTIDLKNQTQPPDPPQHPTPDTQHLSSAPDTQHLSSASPQHPTPDTQHPSSPLS